MKHSHISAYIQAVTLGLQTFFGSCLKISYLIGSKAAFFSSTVIIEPLVGSWVSLPYTLLYYSLRTAAFCFYFKSAAPLLLAYHIPSLCASFYFNALASSSKLTQSLYALIPVSCMLLFVVHPVGSQIWWYSLLWLIPLITLNVQSHFFVQALGATYTSHAMGTVLWLYTHATTAAFWLNLLPIVLIERLTFAAGMTVINYIVTKSAHVLTQVSLRTQQAGSQSCI